MSKVSITRSLLDDLAMSISAKSGEAVPMTLVEMKDAVDDIQTGGTLITKSITQNGIYDAEDDNADGYSSVNVNVSGGTSVQTKTGTFTGSNGVSVDISCDFAPDLIYVYGNLSGSTNNRGVISITIVKDTMILQTSDTSSSSANESAPYFASSGVSGYVGSSSYCHATYSNSTLTITTVSNTSSNRFTSGITYSYKLLKWTT